VASSDLYEYQAHIHAGKTPIHFFFFFKKFGIFEKDTDVVC
jgi:hypothetical protein